MPDLSPESVLAQLQPIFREALDQPELTVTPQSSALNTPQWDSLAHIDLIGMVEAHFGIRFALGELHEMRDVGDMVELILEKKDE